MLRKIFLAMPTPMRIFLAPETDSVPQLDYGSQMRVNANLSAANGWKTGAGEILSVRLEHVIPQENDIFQGGETVRMVIRAIAHQDMDRPILGFLVRDRSGARPVRGKHLAFHRPESAASGCRHRL